MTSFLYTLLDAGLLVLSTLRLSRLVTGDSLSRWLIHVPVRRWATTARRAKLASGLACSFCVGYWAGLAGIVVSYVAGPLGFEPVWWRILFGSLALNYVVGHVASRMGDTDPNSPL